MDMQDKYQVIQDTIDYCADHPEHSYYRFHIANPAIYTKIPHITYTTLHQTANIRIPIGICQNKSIEKIYETIIAVIQREFNNPDIIDVDYIEGLNERIDTSF